MEAIDVGFYLDGLPMLFKTNALKESLLLNTIIRPGYSEVYDIQYILAETRTLTFLQ